jgi:hypothetical protein
MRFKSELALGRLLMAAYVVIAGMVHSQGDHTKPQRKLSQARELAHRAC